MQNRQRPRVNNTTNLRAKSEQKLMKTNFLSQLKQLQELLKESMLDAHNNETNNGGEDEDDFGDNHHLNSEMKDSEKTQNKQTPNEKTITVSLPRLTKPIPI